MRLERVELTNIRQFVGEQKLVFSTEVDRMITLVHGPNTAGKTTLLNAVYWCLYGSFLADFDEPGRLLSEQTSGAEYGVEVWFEHRGIHYVASRKTSGRPDQAELRVLEQRAAGHFAPHPQPALLIQQILPQQLAEFFFFAGELIKKGLSTGAHQAGSMTDAIRTVLGLKLAEQAIEDLKEIRKKKQRELQGSSAGTDLAKVSTAMQAAEDYVESRTQQLSELRSLSAQIELQKRAVFEKLRGLESSSALQHKREKNIAQLSSARTALKEAMVTRQELVSDLGAALFLANAAKGASAFIDDAVTKKRIPSPFDKTFVQDILASALCVCERPVVLGSNEYKAIAALINTATDEAVIRRALAVRGVSERIASTVQRSARALQTATQQFSLAQDRVEEHEQEEARIKDILRKHEEQNVRELEQQLERMETSLREWAANKKRSEDEIESKKAELARLQVEFERAQAASPQIERARTVVGVFDALIRNLERELASVEQQGIARITQALNSVVGSSTRQKYSAEVTTDYVLRLYKDEHGLPRRPVYALSSGEQRLLDLCFVSALVSVCRERESEENAILIPGAVAPLVVDAPFGELDPEYQALAAKTMMGLSDQLILFLSKTHWTKEVDQAIRPQVGKEHLLVGHRASPAFGAAPVEIVIGSRTYQQMHYDAEQSCTEIVPVQEAT